MVIHHLLTALDGATAFVLVTHIALGWFSTGVVVFFAVYIIMKGLIFFIGDWASRIDVLIGIYMLLATLGIFSHDVATIVSVIWLLQKVIFAFVVPLLRIF